MEKTVRGYTVYPTPEFEEEFHKNYGKLKHHCWPSDGIKTEFQAAQRGARLGGISMKGVRVIVHYDRFPGLRR